MKVIWILALNSLREFIRDKVVLVSAFVAIILILFSILIGSLSFGEHQRILAHLGLTAVHLAGLGISVFLGSSILHRELERQTCLLVLARPVDRAQFIIGKYFGILFLNTIIWAILSIVLYTILGFSFPLGNYLSVLYGIWMEHAILTALALCISTFLRPSIAMFTCLTVFLAGNWLDEVTFFVKRAKIELYIMTSAIIEKTVPNLFQMNWRSVYFLDKGVPGTQMSWVLIHGTGWIMLFLCLAVFVFRRKDLV